MKRKLPHAVPLDAGSGSLEIEDNPLMQPQGDPISTEPLSEPALGIRDVDEMGSEPDQGTQPRHRSERLGDRLADRAAREAGNGNVAGVPPKRNKRKRRRAS